MKNKYVLVGITVIMIYMLPYLILGEKAYVTIHDFLDQDVPIIANLKNNGLLTAVSGTVPNMDGLDRSLFQFFTPFDIKMLCCYLFSNYWSVVVYAFVFKVVAFIGMLLLVDNYILNHQHRWLTVGLSFSLAIVPFYVAYGVSGIGFPLLIYAFLNLYKSHRIWHSLICIAVYAFNSSLALGGFFALALISMMICYDWIKNRRINKYVIGGGLFMCIIYMIGSWGNIYALLFSDSFDSHRSEFTVTSSITSDITAYIKVLFFSQYHAGSMVAGPIVLLFACLFWKYRSRYGILGKTFILYVIIVTGIMVGMLLKHSHLHIFTEIQFDRFYFFYPATCLIMAAVCCSVLASEGHRKTATILVLFCILSAAYYDKETRNNIKQLLGMDISEPNYGEFYSTDLFAKIQKDLQILPDYTTKVVAVGMFPSIPEYNGFYTIDSYRANYPLDYKRRFRKVISKELEKNRSLKDYFDDWGSRCYVFSAELYEQNNRYLCGKKDNMAVRHLDIDTQALSELGCEYILSAVEIKNYSELNLKYVGAYSTDNSYWNIRVYKVT